MEFTELLTIEQVMDILHIRSRTTFYAVFALYAAEDILDKDGKIIFKKDETSM